jgi:hypothetical protein
VLGSGELVADRAGPDVDDRRRAGVLDHPERLVEQGVVEAELPHLRVQLEDLDAVLDEVGHVGGGTRLGVERRRSQALGDAGREVSRPVVEVGRDAGAVGIGQRREPSYAERAQLIDAFLVAAAVADRPLAADLGAGEVELRVDLGLHVGRQEVHVDVEEAREVEVLPERAGRVDGLLAHSIPLSCLPNACAFSRLACFSARACRLS